MHKARVFWYLFLLFILTIPLSQYFNVRLSFVLLLISPFCGNIKDFATRLVTNSWDIVFYLIVLSVGLLYSSDLQAGLKVLETNFSFLAIPIVISCVPSFDSKFRDKIFSAFKFGLLAASIICVLLATYRYSGKPDIGFFFFDRFTEPINSHPTYFAYYLIFTISVELYFLYYKQEETRSIPGYLTVLFLFFILILTGGQTAFVSLLFVFSFFILKFFTEEKSKQKKIVTSLISLMLCCMFLVTLAGKGDRLLALNDSWERAVLWESAMSAVSNPFLGEGTGDYKIALNDYYTTHNLSQFASESYNAHNQLIQILFSNGILGVLALSFMLGRPLYMAMKSRNILVILCMFPFLIYGMTEVFLGRYQGVVFFALLHQIFMTDISSEISRAKIPLRESINVK